MATPIDRTKLEEYLNIVRLYVGLDRLNAYGKRMATYYFSSGIPASTAARQIREVLKLKAED